MKGYKVNLQVIKAGNVVYRKHEVIVERDREKHLTLLFDGQLRIVNNLSEL